MPKLIPKGGKESNNLRVSAFCQTPYPTDMPAQAAPPRSTRAVAPPRAPKAAPSGSRAGDPRIATERRSSVMRWSAIGLLAALTAGYYIVTRERDVPVGVVMPNLISRPMSSLEATEFLRTINGSAQVEVRGGELIVRVAAATFPERRDGRLALAQQYARADAIVQEHRRKISFLDPDGISFASADPEKGVTLTR